MSAMTPIDATHQMAETSHLSPSGGDARVVAMVCSVLELARVISQHTSTTTVAVPNRKASLPRRRVWPSPTGAKTIDRQGRFAFRTSRDGAAGSVVRREPASGAETSVIAGRRPRGWRPSG